MKLRIPIHLLLLIIFGLPLNVRAQGLINANFEEPIDLTVREFFLVRATLAVPGWTPKFDVECDDFIFFNSRALAAAAISIHSPASTQKPLQGSYSVFLQGSGFSARVVESASLSQTALVPIGSRSLQFHGAGNTFEVSMNGEVLSLSPLVTYPGTTIFEDDVLYGADISRFAGTTTALRFSALPLGRLFFDSVQFSPVAVPEPSALGLAGVGILMLAWRRARGSAIKAAADSVSL